MGFVIFSDKYFFKKTTDLLLGKTTAMLSIFSGNFLSNLSAIFSKNGLILYVLFLSGWYK